jgi:hypothetical protein
VSDQRDGDERLRDLVRADHDRAQRLVQGVGDVARAAVADDPARHAGLDRALLGHDLVHPVADREHRLERAPALEDLVQRQVVVRDQGGEVVGDAPERALQRVGGEDPGRGVHQRLEGGLPVFRGARGSRSRSRRCGHAK